MVLEGCEWCCCDLLRLIVFLVRILLLNSLSKVQFIIYIVELCFLGEDMDMIRREIGKINLLDKKQLRRKRLILMNFISCLRLPKMQLLNISRKLLGKKHSKNIPTKGVTHRDLKDWKKLMIPCLTLKKDNFMISTERRVLKMEDHQVWARTYSTSSTESKITNQKKWSQN